MTIKTVVDGWAAERLSVTTVLVEVTDRVLIVPPLRAPRSLLLAPGLVEVADRVLTASGGPRESWRGMRLTV